MNATETDKSRFSRFLEGYFESLKDSETTRQARGWLSENQDRIETLFNHPVLLDFIFEPIKDVFHVPGEGEEQEARQIITRVALVNAVIAGLPGSLGIGVFVCIGLELWMAYALSRVVGLELSKDEAIDTLIGWAAGAGGVLIAFKLVLNLVFPIVTAILPFTGFGTALTQLIVTNMFGVVFWILFEELKTKRRFRFPMTSTSRLGNETAALLKHQFSLGVGALSPKKWKLMGERLWSWLKGDIPNDMPILRGDLATTVAMVWLLSGEIEKLKGPLGDEFIGAIRDRYPSLAEASIPQISQHMSDYSAEQMAGVISMVKGKLFERLVARHENGDSDAWQAELHEDESYPGSDIVFLNDDTGEQIEISLKATDSSAYLERSLTMYPDIPIIATDEVVELMGENHMIWAAGVTNEQLSSITDENFEQLLELLRPIGTIKTAGTGVAAALVVQLWPFTMAYIRGNISKTQLTAACSKVLPEAGKAFASRLIYAAALGPVFAWWLLARGVFVLTPSPDHEAPRVIRKMILHSN